MSLNSVVQVATPICYDQFANAKEIEDLGMTWYLYDLASNQALHAGIGKVINFTEITEENMSKALDQVITKLSPSHSSRSADRLSKPLPHYRNTMKC